ncbi:MAG: phosphate ABC transporter permease PstA [Bdellovibrionota bacterium]
MALSEIADARIQKRRQKNNFFKTLTIATLVISLLCLAFFLVKILVDGLPFLNFNFLNSYVSRKPAEAGIKAALAGSFWIMLLTGLFSIPLGIGSAVFIQEYLPSKSRWRNLFILNLSNLAGLPSILYGLLGLTLFARTFGLGGSLLTGALTMSLLILPTIVITSIEALRSVPKNLREGAFALGARKWQVILGNVLPSALPGILTGLILASSRAIGEAAPLIVVGGLSFVAFVPQTPMDQFTVLPLQIFNWASRPQKSFHDLAAAGILVLMAMLLAFNLISILLRYYYGKKSKY